MAGGCPRWCIIKRDRGLRAPSGAGRLRRKNMKSLILPFMLLSCPLLFAGEVSIAIESKSLKGELSVAGNDQSQAVFILSGSGPTDRDGNTVGAPGKNNSLKYLADVIREEGITTLRVDKRGIGASSAAAVRESDLRFATYVEDARRWIEFLKEQGYSEIVLMGHSEGALVATLAASSESVTGLVCIAGAGRPAPDMLREQLMPKLSKELYTAADNAITSLTEGKAVKDYPPVLDSLFRHSVQPYLISWFQIDPATSISEVEIPILIVQGTTDLQVTLHDAKRLHAAAKGSELLIVEGMNHVLKEVDGDLNAQLPSYFRPDLPLHKDLGVGVVRFLKTTRTERAARSKP